MPYKILADPTDYAIIIRDIDQPDNTLTVSSLAEAIKLRNRLTDFINTLEADEATSVAPTVSPVETPATAVAYLSTQAAQELAAEYGYDLKQNTLRMAMTRGNVKAMKHGGRWLVQRDDFLRWLQRLMPPSH